MLHCSIKVVAWIKILPQELKMSEYDGIFDYALSANGYYALNFGFIIAYGLVAALIIPATSYLTIRHRPLAGSAQSAA